MTSVQGFGRVGGSAPPNTGYDSSLGSHVPHGQNVGTASGQVLYCTREVC